MGFFHQNHPFGVQMEMWGVSLAWGKVNNLAKRFVSGDWEQVETVPYHSCFIYVTWRSKEVGKWGGFKVIIWGELQRGEINLYRRWG